MLQHLECHQQVCQKNEGTKSGSSKSAMKYEIASCLKELFKLFCVWNVSNICRIYEIKRSDATAIATLNK